MTYRRVHRLTPLLRFWTVLLALAAALLANLNEAMLNRLSDAFNWYIVGGVTLVFLAVFVVSQIWWAAIGFQLDDEEVRLKHGVISKHLRTARFDRIQAVDVVEPLIARLFGLASVRVETAGGSSSAIEIGYLNRHEAESLREELLIRVGGETIENPDYVIEPIPIMRSLVGALLRGSTAVGIVWILLTLAAPLATATIIPLLVAFVPPAWEMIDRSWRFNARLDDEVLHLSYGLASRRRQSVPLAHFHGISISQPMLWRLFGWWSVSVSVAGYGGASNKSSGTTKILPVGTREQAMSLVALVGALDRAELEGYAAPEGATHPTFTSPKRAWIVSPIDLRQQATTMHRNVAITHCGKFVRRVSMIEVEHIQELSLRRGPVQNLLGLSNVRFDLVPGPVKMVARDMDVQEAEILVDRLRTRELPSLTLGT
ncbi:PH domain-containing protein [Corynebacterium breve]|uniref:PH domain-containing protein n=1 Tax=Corynebacterium breve TaxID=3049799 RepID=A0ABY8VHE8_9CORY|nr:PH domain-containing protein [Corynebacterium breve]WIM68185.1 PH domain-containing protein [Corynebacterium breve]